MKYIIIILCLFPFLLRAQTPTLQQPSQNGGWTNPNPAAYGTIQQGLIVWKQFGFPTGNGVPTGTQKYDVKTGYLYMDSSTGIVYSRNPKNGDWTAFTSAATITQNILNFDSTLGYGFFQVGGSDYTLGVNHEVVPFWSDLLALTSTTIDTSNGFPPHILNILDTPLASAVDGDIYLVSQNPPQFLSDGTTDNQFYTHHNDAAELIDGSYTFVTPGNSQTVTNGFDLGFYEYNLTSDVWNLIYKPHIMGYTAYGIDHVLGVADSFDIVFGTNNIERGRFTADGRFSVNDWQHTGDPTDSNWQVMALPNGKSYVKKGTRLTLTTTGTSGPATLTDSVLNIPQYSGGGSGSTDYVNSGLGIKVDSTGRSYTVNLDTAYTNSLYGAVTSTDTTIYQTVLDSTGASGYKVPFAVNRKLQTSPSFLYDSTQKKLVIGSTNISIGGNPTKLWVTGSAVVSGKLGVNVSNPTNTLHVNGDVRISTIANGTAGTDSVLTVNGGVVKKIAPNYYSTSGGSGATNSNIGSGYRLAVPNTNNIKTIHAGLTIKIDSTSNSNEITINTGDSSIVFLNQYGGDPTGTRSNYAAVMAAYNALPAAGGIIVLGAGYYLFDTGAVFNKPIRLQGAGGGFSGTSFETAGVTFIKSTANITVFTFQKSGSSMLDICMIHYTDSNSAIAIHLKNADAFDLERCSFATYARGLDVDSSALVRVINCGFNCNTYDIVLRNRLNPDYGDGVISNCLFGSSPVGAGKVANIYQLSAGGYKISNCKFNDGLFGGTYCYQGNFSEGTTSIVEFSNCSFENYLSKAIYLPGNSHFTGHVIVTGCEFSSFNTGTIDIDLSTLSNVAITGNSFVASNAANTAISLNTVTTPTVVNSYGGYTTPVLQTSTINSTVDNATPTAGYMLYGNGSRWVTLAAGTSSQILHGGTTPSWKDTTVAGGSGSWQLTGNSGTNVSANFLGTTDNVSLRIRTNNALRAIFDSIGNIGIGTGTSAIADVNGAVRFKVQGPVGTDIMSISDGTAAISYFINNSGTVPVQMGSTTNHKLGLFTNNGLPQLTLQTTGNTSIGTTTDNGYKLDVNGTGHFASTLTTAGNIVAFGAKTSGYNIAATDEIITGDATSVAFNTTLPTAVGRAGQKYTIKKIDASANAVTVNTTSSQTIDGSTTYSLSAQYKYVTVVSNGANWLIIANN